MSRQRRTLLYVRSGGNYHVRIPALSTEELELWGHKSSPRPCQLSLSLWIDVSGCIGTQCNRPQGSLICRGMVRRVERGVERLWTITPLSTFFRPTSSKWRGGGINPSCPVLHTLGVEHLTYSVIDFYFGSPTLGKGSVERNVSERDRKMKREMRRVRSSRQNKTKGWEVKDTG